MRQQYLLLFVGAIFLSACDPRQEFDSEAEQQAVDQAKQVKLTHVPNNVGDLEAGKDLAKKHCATCHGIDGVSARSGSPFIAGVEQDYLVRSMLAYGNGSRKYSGMKNVIAELSPSDIASLSSYYASLQTKWQGAVATDQTRAIVKDTVAFEKSHKLVRGCNSCHDHSGRQHHGRTIPNLDGMPFEYFKPALKTYFSGERHDEVMEVFRDILTDEKIYQMASYYAVKIPHMASPPTVGDPAAGKLTARGCAGCHGYDGNSLNPYVPNLAGQPSEYLIKAIEDYRDGKRENDLMVMPVKNLSRSTIENLAAFYSMQMPESQLHVNIDSPALFDPIAEGQKIATSCDSCHGENGNSKDPGVPSLTGMHVKYLVKALSDYQTGIRQHKAMREFVSFYSDTDLEKVAYYYAMQKPTERLVDDPDVVRRGESISSACTMCHGKNGVSENPAQVPSLAGQDVNYLLAATRAYENGSRHNDSMTSAAKDLSDAELIQVAAYFASQPPQQVETYLPDDPVRIVKERCDRCHGERGYSTQPGVPRLAGQVEPYIVLAMKEYQDGMRKNSAMVAMASVMSLIEIKAVAAYYAKQ